LIKKDVSNPVGFPEITLVYGNGAIRIERKVDIDYAPPVLVIDSSSIDGTEDVLPANIQYRHISNTDGLQLILQYEKLNPGSNEILIFSEPYSEAIQRILRLSIGSSLKKKLGNNPAQILLLNNYLLAQYGNGFSAGEMAEQLCSALFEKK